MTDWENVLDNVILQEIIIKTDIAALICDVLTSPYNLTTVCICVRIYSLFCIILWVRFSDMRIVFEIKAVF